MDALTKEKNSQTTLSSFQYIDIHKKLDLQCGFSSCAILDPSIDGGNLFDNGLYIGTFESSFNNQDKKYVLDAIIPLESTKGLCLIAKNERERELHHELLQKFALRIAGSLPGGMCKFILYDGEGLGRNLITLSTLDKQIKGENILIDPMELKRALQKTLSNIPNIIQRVLGTNYIDKTLVDYNREAGQLAVPYQFVFIADYPANLPDDVCQMVERIAETGSQAGIYVITNLNISDSSRSRDNYDIANLLSFATSIIHYNNGCFISRINGADVFQNFNLLLDSTPLTQEQISNSIERIHHLLKNKKSTKVSIIDEMTDDLFWRNDASRGINVPVGKKNTTDYQYFSLATIDGESATPYHCLIGGVPGSGKTVLLHNILCHTAWMYSPEEVQFILLDFKEGTEFKVYQSLPHARILSVQSDREFGCSVFEFINSEIEHRGELFKAIGAVNIQEYNRKSDKKMPRLLVVIDEFQRLLDGDLRTANYVAGSLDDIGRRGRSFGINMILSTQSLGGVELRPATLGSLGLRIALRLNTQNDCDKLLGNGNYSPYTSLTRPGEAIYNSLGGLSEGNVKFQTAFVENSRIEQIISTIKQRAEVEYGATLAPYKRFFYDGSSEANINDNIHNINNLPQDERKCTVYVGEPVSLNETHLSYRLRRQNESNILIIGADENAAVSILIHSFEQIIRQSSPESKFYIFDKTNVDSEYYELFKNHFTPRVNNIDILEFDNIILEKLGEINSELEKRKSNNCAGHRIVLAYYDIYNIRPLRKSGYTVSQQTQSLLNILRDGPQYGIHTLVYSPSFNNFSQVLDPHQILNEFETKIELWGGEGYKMFNSSMDRDPQRYTPNRKNIANIRTALFDGTKKFKVYPYISK